MKRNDENFFWLNPNRDESFFNEALDIRDPSFSENSGSIDTSAIDGYRQGVEIRTIKHWDAGTIKIHAGEPGHFVKQNTYGLNHKYWDDKAFKDIGGVDPTQLIGATASINRHVTAQPFISVPPPELDSRSFDRYLYDGVIDFLGARRRSVMLCTLTPIDTRGVRGEIQDGNIDEFGGTNKIVSIYDWQLNKNRERPFFDDPSLMNDKWVSNISTTTLLTGSRVSSFSDARLLRNAVTSSTNYPPEMIAALSLMTGSTNNFVSTYQRSATSGWDCDDGNTSGTDSITFIGMTY